MSGGMNNKQYFDVRSSIGHAWLNGHGHGSMRMAASELIMPDRSIVLLLIAPFAMSSGVERDAVICTISLCNGTVH